MTQQKAFFLLSHSFIFKYPFFSFVSGERNRLFFCIPSPIKLQVEFLVDSLFYLKKKRREVHNEIKIIVYTKVKNN